MVSGNCTVIRLSKANWFSPLPLPYLIFLHWGLTSMLLFSITKGKTTVKSGQKFKDVTHISPANSMGRTWATVIAYQLPNNTLLGCFRKGWPCVPSGSNSWPPFTGSQLDYQMVILPLINCSEPVTSSIPYLSHIFLKYCRLYKPSGTQYMGTLEPSDCNNTLTFEHCDPHLCLNVHYTCILCALRFTTAYLLGFLRLVPSCSFFQN